MKLWMSIIVFSFYANGLFAQNKINMRINHVALNVQDLQKSTNFYTDILGLAQIEEPFKLGKHSWFNIGNGAQLHLIAGATKGNQNTQNTHLCFSVNIFEEFLQQLKKAKISYVDANGKVNQTTTRPDGVKQLWLQDPDGFWLEINDAK